MATTMKLIAKNVLASAASSVTFSDIPATFTDLFLVLSARSSRSAIVEDVNIRFNSDTTSGNYSHRRLYSTPTTAVSDTAGSPVYVCAASTTSNTFGYIGILIPNYAGATNKSYSADIAVENNSGAYGDAFVGATAGLWSQTSAITSVQLVTANSSNFVINSSFFLYGITKA